MWYHYNYISTSTGSICTTTGIPPPTASFCHLSSYLSSLYEVLSDTCGHGVCRSTAISTCTGKTASLSLFSLVSDSVHSHSIIALLIYYDRCDSK